MRVSLVSVTKPLVDGVKTAEELVVYVARVSNIDNQLNMETAPKLLRYLIQHRHWSPFEMIDMTVFIETSRAIAAQILRHRSFSFQEFSQRYSSVGELGFEDVRARKQAVKNRQDSSEEKLDYDVQEWFENMAWHLEWQATEFYETALEKGVAREVARFILPLSVRTRLYMKGSVRSWIHYLEARCSADTQLEHQELALAIKDIFVTQFPETAKALKWQAELI